MSEKKKVAVLTTFRTLPSGYGLVPVVLSQLKMLVKHGYTPGFFVTPTFSRHPDRKKVPNGVDLKPFVPDLHLYHYFEGAEKQTYDVDAEGEYVEGHPFTPKTNFDKQVAAIEEMLEPELIKYDVVIEHDLLFQIGFVVHNQAIRNISQRNPHIRWLHWLHSGPSPRLKNLKYPHTLRHSGMLNSYFISPNETMRQKFAEMYNIPIKYVRVVNHVFDPVAFFDMDKKSEKLIEKYNLFSGDVLAVWATRLDSVGAKGIKKAIRLLGAMNKICDARLLFLNSSSNSEAIRATINNLKQESVKWGVPKENLMFSSEMGKKWEVGVPWKVVRDMKLIANMFISPTRTETCGLTMLEAAVCKNILVLNEDLKVMTEFCGDRAEYINNGYEWGGESNSIDHYYVNLPDGTTVEDEDLYWQDRAMKILMRLGLITLTCEYCGKDLGLIGAYKPLMQSRYILKNFTEKTVWSNQLRPLIEDA